MTNDNLGQLFFAVYNKKDFILYSHCVLCSKLNYVLAAILEFPSTKNANIARDNPMTNCVQFGSNHVCSLSKNILIVP